MRTTSSMILSGWCLLTPVMVFTAETSPPPILLANMYRGVEDNLAAYWISEKYDGVRAYWNGETLLTRNGNRIHTPDWFTAGWPRQPLDGELWIGRSQFEALAATVRDAQPDEAAWRRVRFMAFDLPAQAGDFTARLYALNALLAQVSIAWLQAVPQFKVADQAALDAKLNEIVDAGGEGLMLHRGGSFYRAERSDDLLKLKLHEDDEAVVIAHLPGQGKYTGLLGALLVQRADGLQFRLGGGFSDAQRRHPPPIGSRVTYSFNGLTAKGVPRFARFIRVRIDAPIDAAP